MALNKLYYVYGLDTACLYNDEEYEIEKKLIQARCIRAKLIKKSEKLKKEYHPTLAKNINKYIIEKKDKLKKLLEKNKNIVRTVRPEKLTLKRQVGIFDSNLTRCFNLTERILNEEIVIIRVYFFDVAESIVKNGFYMNGYKYVFFSSSAGQIRTKKLVAVREDLLLKHWNTLTAGLTIEKINELGGMNINKYLSYLSLCNSATDLWNGFDIDRCIVVDDFETLVNGAVDYIDNKTFEITRQVMDIPITHTDGCGMYCTNKFGKRNFMVRLPWVKGLLGYFNFRQFISEHDCSPVIKDIYGKEYDVINDNIQIIFTKSQFKMWKYFSSWDEYKNNFKLYGCSAGICNMEEDLIGDATINYQMIQTLFDLSDAELIKISQRTYNEIHDLANRKDTMLKVLGVTPYNKNKSGFQKCLEIYPELLSDLYTSQMLRNKKDSLEKDMWCAKLRINGKYTFLLPDLYAFAEYLFLYDEKPKGLLKNGEIYCNLYPEGKLDCLRSPHLYMEHAIRTNIKTDECNKWFTDKAVYTSSYDLVSKILQFDNDGDKALVVADKTVINAAERIIRNYNIVPLYYEMSKAGVRLVNNDEIFNGLMLAYTGGNIGVISNDISKIWNSGDITEDKLKAVKLLCLQNNFVIDYAKTLYKPIPPDNVTQLINTYTKGKIPHFFIYAKKKKEKQVEQPTENSVNRLRLLRKKQNLNFSFKKSIVGKFNYRMLLKNQGIEIDTEVINKYRDLTAHINYKMNQGDDYDNYNAVFDNIKNEMLLTGYSMDDIVDMLIINYFCIHNSKDKLAFWNIFGDTIYNHLTNNISSDFIQCSSCNKRFYRSNSRQKTCSECIKKRKENLPVLCVDCGKELSGGNKGNTSQRCPECYAVYRKRYKAIKQKELREKSRYKISEKINNSDIM